MQLHPTGAATGAAIRSLTINQVEKYKQKDDKMNRILVNENEKDKAKRTHFLLPLMAHLLLSLVGCCLLIAMTVTTVALPGSGCSHGMINKIQKMKEH